MKNLTKWRGLSDALAIEDMNDIHVFLLDETGRIEWRTQGPADAAKLAELQQIM